MTDLDNRTQPEDRSKYRRGIASKLQDLQKGMKQLKSSFRSYIPVRFRGKLSLGIRVFFACCFLFVLVHFGSEPNDSSSEGAHDPNSNIASRSNTGSTATVAPLYFPEENSEREWNVSETLCEQLKDVILSEEGPSMPKNGGSSAFIPKCLQHGDILQSDYFLSILVVGGDDDRANFTSRFQPFLKEVDALATRMKAISESEQKNSVELVVTQWNPPRDEAWLEEAFEFPESADARIITVSQNVHDTFEKRYNTTVHAWSALNVALRRARGEFVLLTRPDVKFHGGLAAWLMNKSKSVGGDESRGPQENILYIGKAFSWQLPLKQESNSSEVSEESQQNLPNNGEQKLSESNADITAPELNNSETGQSFNVENFDCFENMEINAIMRDAPPKSTAQIPLLFEDSSPFLFGDRKLFSRLRGIPESLVHRHWADSMFKAVVAGSGVRVVDMTQAPVCHWGREGHHFSKTNLRDRDAAVKEAFVRGWKFKNGENWGLGWMDHMLECSEKAENGWDWTEAMWM